MGRADLSRDEARSGGVVTGQSGSHGSTEEQFRDVRRRLYGDGRFLRLADRDQQPSGHELLDQRHRAIMSTGDGGHHQR